MLIIDEANYFPEASFHAIVPQVVMGIALIATSSIGATVDYFTQIDRAVDERGVPVFRHITFEGVCDECRGTPSEPHCVCLEFMRPSFHSDTAMPEAKALFGNNTSAFQREMNSLPSDDSRAVFSEAHIALLENREPRVDLFGSDMRAPVFISVDPNAGAGFAAIVSAIYRPRSIFASGGVGRDDPVRISDMVLLGMEQHRVRDDKDMEQLLRAHITQLVSLTGFRRRPIIMLCEGNTGSEAAHVDRVASAICTELGVCCMSAIGRREQMVGLSTTAITKQKMIERGKTLLEEGRVHRTRYLFSANPLIMPRDHECKATFSRFISELRTFQADQKKAVSSTDLVMAFLINAFWSHAYMRGEINAYERLSNHISAYQQ